MVLLSSFADLGDSTIRPTTRETLRLSPASPGSKAPGKECQELSVMKVSLSLHAFADHDWPREGHQAGGGSLSGQKPF